MEQVSGEWSPRPITTEWSGDFKIEGIRPSDRMRDVELLAEFAIQGGPVCRDRIRLTVAQADLNVFRPAACVWTPVEDRLEHDPLPGTPPEGCFTGGLVCVNEDDDDRDGTPDREQPGPVRVF